ncbi:PREDICTED: uncharacterized protein LOC106809067 [Priapulus caudatus]|uniref:Uncharacterized protein LOC106809067 n=1 Tax=Priapulus caudatus TaxID=37621 RepID=A0ABM1E5M8_PRICU|nr:PREDICTED: uncharacterized protein LOC106809067 [Priapulus caudatus]
MPDITLGEQGFYLVSVEFKGEAREVMITWLQVGSDIHNYNKFLLPDSSIQLLAMPSQQPRSTARTGEPFAVELSSNSIGYKHDAIFLMWTTKSYAPILSYIVLYRAEEDINKPWKRINVPAEKSDGSENHYGSFEITGLHPDSVYQIQIQAKNQHGVSRIEDTWELRTQPEGKEVEKPQSRPRLGTDVSRHLDRNSQGSISSSSRPTFTRVSGFLAFLCAAVISL